MTSFFSLNTGEPELPPVVLKSYCIASPFKYVIFPLLSHIVATGLSPGYPVTVIFWLTCVSALLLIVAGLTTSPICLFCSLGENLTIAKSPSPEYLVICSAVKPPLG